jgi:hypothetical protein
VHNKSDVYNCLYANSHKPLFAPLAGLHCWCGLLSTTTVLSLAIVPLFQNFSASELKTKLEDQGLSLRFGCLPATYVLVMVSPQIMIHALIAWQARPTTWVPQESIEWCTPTSHEHSRVALRGLLWRRAQKPFTIAWLEPTTITDSSTIPPTSSRLGDDNHQE